MEYMSQPMKEAVTVSDGHLYLASRVAGRQQSRASGADVETKLVNESVLLDDRLHY
jgi:hypothetical protein